MVTYAELKEYAELTTSMLQVELSAVQLDALMRFSIIEVYKRFFIETLFYTVPTTATSEFTLPFVPLVIANIKDKDGDDVFFRQLNSDSKIRRISMTEFKIFDNTIFPLEVEYNKIPDDMTTINLPEYLISVFTAHLTYKAYNIVAKKDIQLLNFYKQEFLEEIDNVNTLGMDFKENFRTNQFTAKGYV